tara:strand:+ start:768 stop:1004 length:237 start_codon:yes stop_codon:yes gene_type:complete
MKAMLKAKRARELSFQYKKKLSNGKRAKKATTYYRKEVPRYRPTRKSERKRSGRKMKRVKGKFNIVYTKKKPKKKPTC